MTRQRITKFVSIQKRQGAS